MKSELYFKGKDSEMCYPLQDHINEAKEDGLTEITLIKAVPDLSDNGYKWCSYAGAMVENWECRKAYCTDYRPRGKNGGPCKHRSRFYTHGDKETFKINPKTE